MAGKYDPKILKRVQEYELEILKDFIKVCEENDLTYFASFGTLLGAVRHGGFIPWDDDIDVCMLRDDYNKVLEIFRRDYADKYTVGDPGSMEDYCMMNAHISLNDTFFCEANVEHLDIPKGIFLDVFPYDVVPDDPKAQKKFAHKAWNANKLMIIQKIPEPIVPVTGFAKKVLYAGFALLRGGMSLFGITHRKLYERTLKYCTWYRHEQTGYIGYYTGTKRDGYFYALDEIFPLKKLNFEGIEVCFPGQVEVVLTKNFGDYMQLPPEEKRHNHRPDYIKFPGEEMMVNL